jgi:hypothetical protein
MWTASSRGGDSHLGTTSGEEGVLIRAATTFSRRDWAVVGLPWLVSRALVLLSVAFAKTVVATAGPLRPAVPQHMHRLLLDWDAERYFQIAAKGYAALPRVQVRFFPLVPLLARAVDLVVPGSTGRALLVEANLAALVLGVLVLRLVRFETGDETLARTATWLVFLTPAAFVLTWGYSEPTWLALSVAMVLALRRKHWWMAAAVGVLAGLSRPVAPLLSVAALVEAWPGVWRVGWRERLGRAAAVASPVVGVCLYLTWVWHRFGSFLVPYRIQQSHRFRGSLTDPVTPLWHTAQAAAHGDWLAGLRVAWAVVLVALVVVAFVRWPPSYGVFGAVTLLVALSTQRLGSFERYGFSAFPVTLAAAAVARRRHWLTAVGALGAAALVGYGTLALLGSYVP